MATLAHPRSARNCCAKLATLDADTDHWAWVRMACPGSERHPSMTRERIVRPVSNGPAGPCAGFVFTAIWLLAGIGCSSASISSTGGTGGAVGGTGANGGTGTNRAGGAGINLSSAAATGGTGGSSKVCNASNTSGCKAQNPPACGDGINQPPEQCDDGNMLPGDGCNGVCQV